ncbi:TPA: hypothetical protein NJ393_000258 [Vibrio parahaemolyticus]|uniref:hypothetical protein n=1 Tax=Vibrio parahaemolyticus TaxID=670 RepID=UPI001D400707|nr:hypothetical protein [Vibrio parahaemolyticus]EHY0932782.1 hypothetical protein [Vibrio parahaemolyticus]EJG0939650.1 hypothetical protein [Vibrio parahaemolyticus O1]MDB6192283.1 hypothetical protein [Vibrio parahaemolyticus]HCG7374410.1 hypothetical protein [Vibrio parahaemolyticus]
MPRKRLLYSKPEQILEELLTKRRSLQSIYVARFRALNIYDDRDQYDLICDAIKMYQAHQKIKSIKF